MSGIFISYRRGDSAGHTGRLTDDLGNHLDHQALLRAIEAIEAGVDFVHALEKAVSACTVMLVIIGPNWASAATADGTETLVPVRPLRAHGNRSCAGTRYSGHPGAGR